MAPGELGVHLLGEHRRLWAVSSLAAPLLEAGMCSRHSGSLCSSPETKGFSRPVKFRGLYQPLPTHWTYTCYRGVAAFRSATTDRRSHFYCSAHTTSVMYVILFKLINFLFDTFIFKGNYISIEEPIRFAINES